MLLQEMKVILRDIRFKLTSISLHNISSITIIYYSLGIG